MPDTQPRARMARPRTDPPRLEILGVPSDRRLAEDIKDGLGVLGIDVTTLDAGQPNVVLALVSRSALEDEDWRSRIENLSETLRIIPVGAHGLDRERVPSRLNRLNWIFSDDEPELLVPRLFAAIHTNLDRYEDSRDSRAQAARWIESGKSPDFLLDNVRETQRRLSAARHAVQDAADALPDTAVAYLMASERYAKGLRRSRIWGAIWRGAAFAGTAVAVAITIVALLELRNVNNNSAILIAGENTGYGRPDLNAIKAGSLLGQTSSMSTTDMRFRVITESLSRHWDRGFVGPTHGRGINDLAFLGSETVLGVDAFGNLAQWGLRTSVKDWIHRVSDAPNYHFATTSDGAIGVAADSSQLRVLTSGGVIGNDIAVPGGIEDIEITDDGESVVIAAPDGGLLRVDSPTSSSARPVSLGSWDRVLALARTTAGAIRALVSDRNGLALVDADGRVIAQGPVPGGAISVAGIAPDGEFVAVVMDGELWTSGVELVLAPSGVVLPGIASSIAVTLDHLVVAADRSAGTRLIEPAQGLVLGNLCDSIGAASRIVVAPNQQDIVCGATGAWNHDQISELRPVTKALTAPDPVTRVQGSGGTIASLAIVDGLLAVAPADGEAYYFDGTGRLASGELASANIPAGSPIIAGYAIGASDIPTTVAINPNGTTGAAGFRDGGLIEFDVLSDGQTVLVANYALPGHRPIVEVVWDGPNLLATDVDGNRWTRESCSGCFDPRVVIAHIQRRVWTCYLEQSLAELGEAVRSTFELRPCALPPAATEG